MNSELIVQEYLGLQDNEQIFQQGNIFMDKECKVAVLVPVYDEQPELILRCLASLASQNGVRPQDYEIVINVNNKKSEARQSSAAYLTNQKVLKVLEYLAGKTSEDPGLSLVCKKYLATIKAGKLNFCFVDSFSLAYASEKNTVGVARDTAARLAVARFSSIRNYEGIIVSTDADCTFSTNYISEIIKTFSRYPLNGLCGDLLPEVVIVGENASILLRIAEILNEPRRWPKQLQQEGKNIYFQKRDCPDIQILHTGQNMAFRLIPFIMAGGFTRQAIWEDIDLAKKIRNLPGETAYNSNYFVTTLVRPSERAGFDSFGRRVKFTLDSVEEFRKGKSDGIYMLNTDNIRKFLYYLFHLAKEKKLTAEWLRDLMSLYEFRQEQLEENFLNYLAESFNEIFSKREKDIYHLDLETDNLLLGHLFDRFPTIDITSSVNSAI
jgi:hypothetical protein